MKRNWSFATLSIITGAILSTAGLASADSFKYDGLGYKDVKVVGLKDGQMTAALASGERTFEISKLEEISIDGMQKFTDAEAARKNPAKAAALYIDAIRTINRKEIHLLAEARSIVPLDASGKWLDAVTNFLDVYAYGPTPEAWELRPKNLPASGSKLLGESADRINSRLSSFKSTDALKNLKTFLLEIYTKANDPRAAKLAAELGSGTVETVPTTGAATPQTPTQETPTNTTPAATGSEDVSAVDAAIKARKYDDAIALADNLLASATGEPAITLFELKARAYQAQNKLNDASLALMRIAVFYPTNARASAALLQAADLQAQLKNQDAAKRLYKEVVDKYPNSPSGQSARKKLTP